MHDRSNDFPSKSDSELIIKLGNKGKDLIEDLNKIFSYKKPREYKFFVEKRDYTPTDDEKIVIDLILIIKKYNEVLKKKMSLSKMKKEENKNFSLMYKGMKHYNSEIFGKEANSIRNLYGNLINKYQEKHIIFNEKFLSRNIFNRCGLLPYTKKEIIDFFESEINNYGQNNLKSLKVIKYIQKLYEQIEKASHKISFGNQRKAKIKSQKTLSKEKQMELLDKKNKIQIQKREIENDIEEIKQIKELIIEANNRYNEIIKELSTKKSKNKRRATKISIIKNINISKNKDNTLDKNGNMNKIKTIESKNNFPNIISKTIDNEGKKTFYKLKTMKSLDKYNKTASLDKFNGLNLANNRMTATTGFNDFRNNNSNSNTSYKADKIIFNNLYNQNNVNLNDDLTKRNFPSTTKTIPRNISRNNKLIDMNKTSNNNIFQSNIFNKINKDSNKNVKSLLKTSNLFNNKILTPNMSSPNFLNSKIGKNIKNDIFIPKSNFKRKKINSKKNKSNSPEKGKNKLELYLMRRKKIPKIYEELQKYKNILNVVIKSKNKTQRNKIEKLFSQLYDIKKIRNLDEKKAPKELYNSYYNMKDSIERCHGPDKIYNKYKGNLGDSLRKKIGKSLVQDDELKNKYYDFMQMIIKKKIVDEDED